MAVGGPPERALDEEPPHLVALRAVEVERGAPWSAVPVGEVRAEVTEDVAFGAEVVVHDVEHDGEVGAMAGIHESPQTVGTAVAVLCRERGDAVVAPVSGAGKLGDRHELDRGDAQVAQRRQLVHDAVEGAGGGERPDVQLVEHEVGHGRGPEAVVGPVEAVVDDRRRPVDAVGLPARGGVGPQPVVEPVPVAGPGGRVVDGDAVVAAVVAHHRHRLRGFADGFERERDAVVERRPDLERRPAVRADPRAERHAPSPARDASSGANTTMPRGGTVISSDCARPCAPTGVVRTAPRLPTPLPP